MLPNDPRVNILLVDDHPANLVALEAVLETLGENLVRAASGKEALERVQEQDFAAILLDVQMPGMDGFETARRIREVERARQTPILFLTAVHRGAEHEARGYAHGAVDYIAKPFDPDALRSKVAALVEVSRRSYSAQHELVRACHAAILEASPDAVITIDAESSVVEWNAAAERILGRRRAEVLGADLAELVIPPGFRAAHRTGMARYLSTGEGVILGTRLQLAALHASGRELPVELTVTRIPSVGPPLFTAYLRDLTDQKRHEARSLVQFEVTRILAESPGLAQAVPHLMRAICHSYGWDWSIYWEVDRNRDALRMIDSFPYLDPAETDFASMTVDLALSRDRGLPGRVWASGQPLWIDNIGLEPNFPRAEAALQAGFRSALAFPIRSTGGVLGIMEFFSREPRESDTAAAELLSSLGSQIGQFIQRKRAEEELQRQQERLHHLQSVTDAALAHLPLDELLNALLERVCRALHADTATVLLLEEGELAVRACKGLAAELKHAVRVPLGQGFAGAIAATCKPRIIPELDRAEVHSPHLREAGLDSLLGVPLLVQGQVIGVLHVGSKQPRHFTDDDVNFVQLVGDRVALAADRARLIHTLEEESARKSDFLSIMAHELRTPLSAITNALYILENIELPDDRAARQVLTANRQTRQLARLVEDLMDVGRISKGKIELRQEAVAICDVARGAAEAVRPFAEARGQEFGCQITPETLLVEGDPDRLEQVITNLLQNAVKYTEPGGEIRLLVQREEGDTIVQVRDTGIGIDPPLLPQIFDLFQQIDRQEARARGGMGIGLALVKRLVELHGGTIEAASAGRGRGAEITVRLPLLEGPPSGENTRPSRRNRPQS